MHILYNYFIPLRFYIYIWSVFIYLMSESMISGNSATQLQCLNVMGVPTNQSWSKHSVCTYNIIIVHASHKINYFWGATSNRVNLALPQFWCDRPIDNRNNSMHIYILVSRARLIFSLCGRWGSSFFLFLTTHTKKKMSLAHKATKA